MGVFVNTFTSIQYRMLGTDFTNSNSAALFSEAATAADDDIRGKLAKRYDISSSYFQTSTSAPPLLRKVGQDLVIAYMIEGLSQGSENDHKRADKYYKRAMMVLDDLAQFKMNLYNTSGSLIAASSSNHAGVKSNTVDYYNTFNEDAIENWSVDEDKLDDISDERD